MTQKRQGSPLSPDLTRPAKSRRPGRTAVSLAPKRHVLQHAHIKDVASALLKPQNEYEYSKITNKQLRLLELHPARDQNDSIVCELRAVNFTDLPNNPYDALSYCWGTSEPTEEISIRVPPGKLRDVVDKIMKRNQRARATPQKQQMYKELRTPWQKRFYVTKNLQTALRYLREEDQSITLWVDAICINQDDDREKGQQVARIAEIFNKASWISIWLGEAYPGSEGVLDFVSNILDLRALERSVSDPKASPQVWYQLSELLNRPWFTRRWVVQELGLANKACLHLGRETLHWDDFAEAVALFAREAGRIDTLFQRSPEYVSKRIGNVRSSGAFSIIETTNNLFRWSGTDSSGRPGQINAERLTSLEELVSRLVMFNARDPRDTIFAMLSLAKDIPSTFEAPSLEASQESDASLVADYTSSVLEVFKNFVAHCTVSGSLDIICRHWAPNELPWKPTPENRLEAIEYPNRPLKRIEVELPSWILPLKGSAFSPPFDSLSGSRRAADDLVGPPGKQRYDAARGTKADVRFGEIDSDNQGSDGKAKNKLYEVKIPDWTENDFKMSPRETLKRGRKRLSDGCLIVKGFKSGHIHNLSDRLQDGTISKEALELSGWTVEMEEDSSPLETIWKTFVADRDPHGDNPPLWYRRALLTCVALKNDNGDIHPHKVRDQLNSVPMHDFLDRLEAVLWNKKLMALKSKNGDEQFGIAPHQAEMGDLVCVLLGCSVPVVLREMSSDAGTYYQFIGEAYCYNLMEGEALRQFGDLDDEALKQRDECIDFRLR